MKKQFFAAMKAGALFGTIMGAFYLVLNFIPGFIGGFKFDFFIKASIVGVSIALICGLLFGLFMFLISFFLTKKFEKVKKEIEKERDIVFDEPANHFVGIEGVGGWLFLFSDTFCFRSHALNIQTHTMEIPLSDIVSAERCRISRLSNKGILIKTVQGKEEKFVVNSPSEWVEKINAMIN